MNQFKFIFAVFIAITLNGCFMRIVPKTFENKRADGTYETLYGVEETYETLYYDKLSPKDYAYISTKALISLANSLFMKELSKTKPAEKQIVAISDSLTSSQTYHDDLNQINGKVFEGMIRSEYFSISRTLGGEKIRAEAMLKEARKARENAEFNQDRVIEKDNLLLPKYAYSSNLTAKNIRNNRGGGYIFLYVAELVDLTTGEIVWNYSCEITKVAKDTRNQGSWLG